MVKPIRLLVCLLVLSLLALAAPASAEQQYLFEVPEMTIDLRPQVDGQMNVQYRIVFKNLSPDALDIVDIGVPHSDYSLPTFNASIDGKELPDIRRSQYVNPGVEIPLYGNSIPTGRTATLKVTFTQPKMVYYDDSDKAFTSVEFGNTYFGSEYAKGTMELTVRYHFPVGITGNETKWHGSEPTKMSAKGDHIVFTWVNETASPSQMYKFGIGFPSRYMNEGAITEPNYFADCIAALFGLALGSLPILFPILFFLVPVLWRYFAHRRRMQHYLPPSVGIEGAGPKRGLTAPEAAVVMELRPDKVIMMVLFGLIKKEAVRVISQKPLRLEKADPLPGDLRPYELLFIKAIRADGTVVEKGLREMFIAMVKSVNAKLKGFSRKETREYYKNVMNVAWEKVQAANTPELGDAYASRVEWLMMDGDFDDRTSRRFKDIDVVIMPRWWGHGWHGSYGGAHMSPASGGGFTIPGANMANDFTSALGNFSNNMVDSVQSFASSITQTTNPPPVTSSSSGRSSGGGCACACACAGCACACAGGGR